MRLADSTAFDRFCTRTSQKCLTTPEKFYRMRLGTTAAEECDGPQTICLKKHSDPNCRIKECCVEGEKARSNAGHSSTNLPARLPEFNSAGHGRLVAWPPH